MLTLAGSFRLGRFTLFRDRVPDEDGGRGRLTSRFFAVADEPRLARRADGGPEFDFLWYRRPAGDRGPEPPFGGLVTLTAELGPTAEERRELAAAVAERFAAPGGEALDGDPEILAVPFHAGTVELAFAGEEAAGELVRGIAGSGPARLAGNQAASFAVELDADGAALLAGAIEAGTDLFFLRYDLVFAHRLDGVELRVWCDAERAHAAAAERLAAGGEPVSGGLGAALVERRLAGVEIVAAEPLDPAHAAALEELGTRLLDAALAAAFAPGEDGGPGPLAPQAAARLNFTLTRSYPVEGHLAVQAPLALGPAAELGDRVRKVDPGHGFFDRLEVRVIATVDFAASPIDAVKVTLAYDHTAPGGARVARQGELVLRAGEQSGMFRTDLAAPELRSVSWRAEVFYDGGGPPAVVDHPPAETTVVVLDLDDFGVLAVDAELRDVPFERVRGAVVDLEYPAGEGTDARSHRLILDAAHPAGWWRAVVRERPGPYRWRAAWLGAGGERIEGEWRTATGRRLVLDAPDALARRAEVELVAAGDFAGLAQIVAEVAPDAEPDLDPGGEPGREPERGTESDLRHEPGGEPAAASESDPRDEPGTSPGGAADPAGDGRPPAAATQLSFTAPGERHTWHPPAAAGPGPPRYRVRLTLVSADGVPTTLGWQRSDRRLFVVRDPLRVEVEVVPRLLDLGGAFSLGLLELEPGHGAAAAGTTPATPAARRTLVLRDPAERPRWSFRAAEPGRTDYRYRLTLVPRAGERVVTPWTPGRDELLVLRPPDRA